MPDSTEPFAYGQVWRYGAILWMLIARADVSSWWCKPLHWDSIPEAMMAKVNVAPAKMYGLHDDPSLRLSGWERVE